MFEKEIKFISDFCLNKVKGLGSFFTYEKLAGTDLHPAILRYISAELDYMIYVDRKKLLQHSYFDYSGKEIFQRFHEISNEIKKTKKISIEDVKKLIIQAVSFNANYVVKPKWSLTKLIYHDLKYVSADELEMMLNYVYYYDYIKNVLAVYFSKRKIIQLSATEFDLILNKIDRELFKSNADQLIYNALKSIGDFFNIGGLDKTKVSPIAVEILLKEKNLVNYLLNLRRAIPVTEGAKKEYDIEDIQRVLLSPTPVEPETDKAEVEEELESEEQTESIPVDEEFAKEEEKDVDEESEEVTKDEKVIDEDTGGIKDEKTEKKTLGQLADDHAAELENAEMSNILNSEEEKLIEMYEKELKELDDESSSEKATDETLVEDLFEEITEEDIEQVTSDDTGSENTIEEKTEVEEQKPETESDDKYDTEEESIAEEVEETNNLSGEEEIETEKPDEQVDDTLSEKEIVDEMIDDYFVEQTEVDKPEEKIFEKSEIPETSVASEEETDEETYLDDAEGKLDIPQEIDSLEDELLEVFEELDEVKSEAPKVENLAELEQEEIKDFEEDLSETSSSEVDVEQKLPDEEELSEIDSIDGDLGTVDETAFTNDKDTADEYKDEPEKDIDQGLDEINKELYQYDEEFEEQEEEEQLGEEFIKRKNNLFSYMKRKEIKKITSSIFGGDELDFVTTIEKISECATYKKATEILKGLFFSYKISPFSKEAIMFTNAVSNYFRQV